MPTVTATPTQIPTPEPENLIDPYAAVVLPPLWWFAYEIEKEYPDVDQISRNIGVDRDTVIYMIFTIGENVYVAVFAGTEGRWGIINVIETDMPNLRES